MRAFRMAIPAVLLMTIAAGVYYLNVRSSSREDSAGAIPSEMKITSEAFVDRGNIPSAHTCDGDDVRPSLSWSGVPDGTKSLALIVDDPDAPMGTWVHWTIWNIPGDATGIGATGTPKDAIEGMTSFGKPGYGGPCPPSGTHRYFFKLYALDTTLSLPSSSKKADLEMAMAGHVIDEAVIVGLYARE